jgi:hypothetical protein
MPQLAQVEAALIAAAVSQVAFAERTLLAAFTLAALAATLAFSLAAQAAVWASFAAVLAAAQTAFAGPAAEAAALILAALVAAT